MIRSFKGLALIATSQYCLTAVYPGRNRRQAKIFRILCAAPIRHSIGRLTSGTKRSVSTAGFEPKPLHVSHIHQANTLPIASSPAFRRQAFSTGAHLNLSLPMWNFFSTSGNVSMQIFESKLVPMNFSSLNDVRLGLIGGSTGLRRRS